MTIIKINKNNVTFLTDSEFSDTNTNFFTDTYKNYEEFLFEVIDKHSDSDLVLIDVGAWIGPISLYSSRKNKKVICFEPNYVAFDILKKNIQLNGFDNIIYYNFGIGQNINNIKIFSKGKYSFSNATLLNEKYLINNNLFGRGWYNNFQYTSTKNLIDIIKENNITADEISLIKIDVEGYELIIIPTIENYLKQYKPKLLISIHWNLLEKNDAVDIITKLINIYEGYYSKINNEKSSQINENISEYFFMK